MGRRGAIITRRMIVCPQAYRLAIKHFGTEKGTATTIRRRETVTRIDLGAMTKLGSYNTAYLLLCKKRK